MCICRPKPTSLISRHRSVSSTHLRTLKLVTSNTRKPSFEESFSATIKFLQQLHLCSRSENFNQDLVSYLHVGKLERLSLIDLSFLERFISTSSHRGWERSLSPFSSFRERHLPSLSSYTEYSTTSTNRFEFYNQFELLTPFVMLQISFINHIGLYRILHEAWQLKFCGLSILSILNSCLATKLAVVMLMEL
ncbi:hypothetical protein HA466_0199530 [Hirschfeldia incana]|nr:hypothetical protein HA466_0199530 [Hirschfeldia incana]